MNHKRLLALSAATIAGGLVLTAATLNTPPQAHLEPYTADLIEWQQSCYLTDCSTWEDVTVTGTTQTTSTPTAGVASNAGPAEISVPLACDHERCSTQPDDIPTVVTRP